MAPFSMDGGEGGIRTLDTVLPYTHFPGVLLQPLGHLSRILVLRYCCCSLRSGLFGPAALTPAGPPSLRDDVLSHLRCSSRTLDTVLPYTHFPGVLLQPLGHLSRILVLRYCCCSLRSGLFGPAALTPAGPPSLRDDVLSHLRCSSRTLDTVLPYTHFPGVLVTPGIHALHPAGRRRSAPPLRIAPGDPLNHSDTSPGKSGAQG